MAPPNRAATAAGSESAPLVYAGLQLRIVAFILDLMVLTAFGMLFVAAAIAYILIFEGDDPSDSAILIAVGIVAFYLVVFVPSYHVILWNSRGQTVGKMAVHLKVVSRDGGRVSMGRSALRLVGYFASTAPLMLGLVMALFDRQRRTLHDHLAGTVVVELP
jgi:uncharacterized RDD family membrane protein YckC